jgi:hypothetical protein
MLHIPITGTVFISASGNRTKKIKTHALVPFEMSGGNFEQICIIAPGIIADCILGSDFLNKFQVTISFEDQCMYNKSENDSRRHQFVSEEMSKAELKEEASIREIRKSTIKEDETGSGCNNKRKGRNLGILASDIAYDNRKFPLRECDGDSEEKSMYYLQHTTVCANPSSGAVDTRAIQETELLRMVEEASSLSIERKTEVMNHMSDHRGTLHGRLVWTCTDRVRGRPLHFDLLGCVYKVCQTMTGGQLLTGHAYRKRSALKPYREL